jgi:cytidylate kinase
LRLRILYISVDLFARWRITNPLQYFLRLRDERSAQSRLDDILGSETRNAVAKHELIEIICTTKDRVPLRDAVLTDAEKKLDMGSLVPIQKGRKLVEHEIFTAAGEKVRVSKPADVVVLSSAYGSWGLRIATAVGEVLDVPVYNHSIVAHIAKTANVRIATVETLDETARGAIDDYVTALFREKNFNQSDYFRALSQTIAALWRHGPCIFVGHGSHYLIPLHHRLAVRTMASSLVRRRRVEQTEGLDDDMARRKVERKDAEREAFIRRFFGERIEDPLSYDLVINTSQMTITDAAAVIVEAFRRRFPADG